MPTTPRIPCGKKPLAPWPLYLLQPCPKHRNQHHPHSSHKPPTPTHPISLSPTAINQASLSPKLAKGKEKKNPSTYPKADDSTGVHPRKPIPHNDNKDDDDNNPIPHRP